jgi:hypothetical protein
MRGEVQEAESSQELPPNSSCPETLPVLPRLKPRPQYPRRRTRTKTPLRSFAPYHRMRRGHHSVSLPGIWHSNRTHPCPPHSSENGRGFGRSFSSAPRSATCVAPVGAAWHAPAKSTDRHFGTNTLSGDLAVRDLRARAPRITTRIPASTKVVSLPRPGTRLPGPDGTKARNAAGAPGLG